MKALLCSVPVEGVNEKLDRERWEGPLGISPQIAIISIIKWMEKNGYTKDNYDFYDIYLLYPKDEDIIKYITENKPNIVGLSAVVSTSYSQVKRLSKIIKSVDPNIITVVGGYLTASSDTILKKAEVDLCVVGDGEITWTKILKSLEKNDFKLNYEELKNIKGLTFLENDKLIFTGYGDKIPDEDIPYPDYEILKLGP